MVGAASSRLPAHHVRRPRLTGLCAADQLIVVEAAGGYGKSVLAAELVDEWGAVAVWVALEPAGVSARLLVARLRAALQRAGLTDAAAALAAAGDDPPGAVDAMLTALAAESFAIVVDDAHHSEPDAAALIDRIAGGPLAAGRLVVLARYLPRGLERLRRAGPLHVDAAELALAPSETLELCRAGFGLEVSAEEGRALDAATGGWTAAAVLAASRCKRSARPIGAVAPLLGGSADAIEAILEEALAGGGHDRELFARIAAPPLLDRELLAELTGEPAFLERALAWGLPLHRTESGWWALPDPVREHLAALATAPAGAEVLLTAAAHYERRGAFGTALQTLLAAGEAEAVAAMLDGADPWVIETVDALELLSVLDSVPDEVLDRHPRGLLHAARCLAGSWVTAASAPLFARLDALVAPGSDPELRRALDVELLGERLDRGEQHQAGEGARRVLASAGPDERLTAARALTILGLSLARRRDAEGRLDAAALREATGYMERAAELQRTLGNRPAAATVAMVRAVWIEQPLGRPEVALEAIDTGLALVADHPRRFAQLLFCRAYVQVDLGRHAEVETDLEEVERIARQLGDRWLDGYVAWTRMVAASVRGDAETTANQARAALAAAQLGNWWMTDGSEFLAEAADCLDRVGLTALAGEQLERARREVKRADAQIAMAGCALLARHGDARLARERLATVERHGIAPRERWRVTLLQAYAAFREADPAAAGLAARAFEQAAELGRPQAPLLRERELTESLLALAAETGMPAARALQATSLPTAVAVLGRFALTIGGRPVSLGNSQEARLLKFVAISGPSGLRTGASGGGAGGVHVEQAIEALWPEVAPRAGRSRLRTVLFRLRDAAPGAVERDGDRLSIGAGCALDLARFSGEARQALALRAGDPPAAVALARSAIARHHGPLLPGDPYEPWVADPREAVQRTLLELLDMCAATAAELGDLDEARRMVQRTIALAPHDEQRYLGIATILHRQGRKGAALSVLRRAGSALAELGIDPPPALQALERSIAGRVRSAGPPTVPMHL